MMENGIRRLEDLDEDQQRIVLESVASTLSGLLDRHLASAAEDAASAAWRGYPAEARVSIEQYAVGVRVTGVGYYGDPDADDLHAGGEDAPIGLYETDTRGTVTESGFYGDDGLKTED